MRIPYTNYNFAVFLVMTVITHTYVIVVAGVEISLVEELEFVSLPNR